MLSDPVLLGSLLVMLAVAAYAWLVGQSTERAGALLVVGGAAATGLAWLVSGRPDPVFAFALGDLALFVGFMALGWRSRQTWPLVAAGFQAMAVAIHAIRMASPAMPARTYLTALAVPGCGALAAVCFGAFMAMKAKRAGRSS